ncbi:LacI family DNA-binding transcriptional regulator [Bacillus suaedaesalsae]|uniref:LacI family DNA-binding transcriptional regulator n=1 Tax=Bacillus suaedaesalsae TaxID=2810349 RepID=A0ABS2DL37_9BACI|nr:LacI family DNA-binding transcriptional regulator [Bacillus suaedaesalsae]MBM6619207.1 LacI family DNA-binding transcriptional regulator [Bacillus suaedaesalsae]
MGISIIDLAKHCNLSVSTVSRALNNQYGVSEKARQKVLKAVDELRYVPNEGAKELVRKRSNVIGLILHGDDYEVEPAFLHHLPYINQVLNEAGKDTMIQTISRVNYHSGELQQFIQKRNFEGCIIFPGFLKGHPIFDDVLKIKTPVVVLEEEIEAPHCSSINTDEILGGELATEHLILSGHKHIGFINGLGFIHISNLRFQGYKKALEKHGIPYNQEYVMESNYKGEGGAEASTELLQRNPEITAIFFANDVMAMGAISNLSKRNIAVPQDISIVGYDGHRLSQFYNPPLTTIQIQYKEIGGKAAHALLELIEGRQGKSVSIVPRLLKRESVKRIDY